MESAISTEEKLILSMLHGMWQTRGLSIIVGLGIPELLASTDENSPISIEEIAVKTGCKSSKLLYPIMQTLAQWGIGVELEDKHFAKNKALEILRRDKGTSIGHAVEYHCSEEHFSALRFLGASVKNGKPSFESDHGMSHFEYMQDSDKFPYDQERLFEGASKHPVGSLQRRKEFADNFNNAMAYWTELELLPDSKEVNTLYKAYPWEQCKTIVDLGGCSGYFLASILNQKGCEHITGFVIDLPEVVVDATKNLSRLDVEPSRIQFIAHDFKQPFPSDTKIEADTLIVKNILMCFMSDEEQVVKVLGNCRKLMPESGGKVLVIDYCSPDSKQHNIGINGLQLGFWSLHYISIGASCYISKSEWVKKLEAVGSRVGYSLVGVRDTFPGGCTIFELCY